MISILHNVTEPTPFGEITRDMPRAYMGLAKAFLPARVARICMSCDDKAEAEAMARAEGMEMSHGLCDACAGNFLKTPIK